MAGRPLITDPPKALRKAKLDNIALVPASLLQVKESTYQPLANTLPKGTILLVQTASPKQQKILDKVRSFLRTHGRAVFTMPIEQLQKKIARPRRTTAETLQLAL